MANTFSAIQMGVGSAAAPSLYFDAGTGFFKSGTGVIGYGTGGSEVITIEADKTTMAQAELRVQKSGAQAIIRAQCCHEYTSLATLTCASGRGTLSAPDNLNSGDNAGIFLARAFQTGATFAIAGYLSFTASENHSNTALGTEARVWVVPNGTTQPSLAVTVGNNKTLKVASGIAAFGVTPPTSQPAKPAGTDSQKITGIIAILSGAGLCV